MEYVLIGRIINTFGIKGELKIKVFTDFKEERFKLGSKVYLGKDREAFVCNKYRMHKGFMILSFKDYEDINLIEKYKNYDIYKSIEDIKPLENNYFFRDLQDLDIIVNNNVVGKVLNMEEGIKYNYLRVITSDNKQVLIPFIDSFVEEVNIKNRFIKIKEIEGLL